MKRNSNIGGGAVILICFFLSMLLVVASVVISLSKQKSVQRAVASEYNMRTYYVALAGINECIASRMAPRSNVVMGRKDLSEKELNKLKRVYNSGKVYRDHNKKSKNSVLGEYSYYALIMSAFEKGLIDIDTYNEDITGKEQRYLVYSEGVTIRENGEEDKVIIEALFDLNRFDDDPFNADEMETFNVIPSSDPKFKDIEDFLDRMKADRQYPMVRAITFNSYRGEPQVYGVHSQDDKLHISNVGVRSKVNIEFTEPIDAKFLDGIVLKDETNHKTIDNIEKIALSPRDLEVVLLPEDKSNGQIFDFDTDYTLEINDIIDVNGNVLPEGPEITFKTAKEAEIVQVKYNVSGNSQTVNPFAQP